MDSSTTEKGDVKFMSLSSHFTSKVGGFEYIDYQTRDSLNAALRIMTTIQDGTVVILTAM